MPEPPLPLAETAPDGARNWPTSSGRVKPNRLATASTLVSRPSGMPKTLTAASMALCWFMMPKPTLSSTAASETLSRLKTLLFCWLTRPLPLRAAFTPESIVMANSEFIWSEFRPMATLPENSESDTSVSAPPKPSA